MLQGSNHLKIDRTWVHNSFAPFQRTYKSRCHTRTTSWGISVLCWWATDWCAFCMLRRNYQLCGKHLPISLGSLVHTGYGVHQKPAHFSPCYIPCVSWLAQTQRITCLHHHVRLWWRVVHQGVFAIWKRRRRRKRGLPCGFFYTTKFSIPKQMTWSLSVCVFHLPLFFMLTLILKKSTKFRSER